MKKFITLSFLLVAAGCTQEPQTDLDGLKATEEMWQSAYDAEGSAELAAMYAQDAILMPPNSNSVVGRAAIEVFWDGFKASGVDVQINDTEVYGQGSDGYTVGTYTASDANGATVDEGKYLVIWRYDQGQWQLYRDIFNSNLPLPAPEPEVTPEMDSEDEAQAAGEV